MKAETKSFVKDILYTTMVLVIIAVVAGAILGVVSELAKIDPQEVLEKKLSAVYESDGYSANLYDTESAISDKTGHVIGVYVPNSDKDVVIIHSLGNGAYKKSVEIMVVIKNYEITKIMKYRSGETPGIGSKAFTDEHLSQYLGNFKGIDKFELTKTNPNGNIDAATSATRSSTGVNNAVNAAVKYYVNVFMKEGGAK